MNPVTQIPRFDLSLATPAGRSAWAIAAILFGGALILDLATGRGGQAAALGCARPQVTKPHAVAKLSPGQRAWNEALMGESRLSLSPARVRHAS